jgi:hypothetical protein
MSLDVTFSQLLRPVGQMLEPLQIESFSLKIEDSGGVHVSAQKREERRPPPAPEVSLRVVWQTFRRHKPEPVKEPESPSGVLELHYTRDDIARIDAEEQARRKGTGGTPEAHALSQIFRAVGAYVDQKSGKLLAFSKANDEITIEYESALKKKLTEQFTVASLYDYWVKMYKRRRA